MADEKHEVVVTDVKIPFWSMVVLLVKWAIAAIPAFVILLIVAAVVSVAVALLFGSDMHQWGWGRRWL